MILMLLVVHVLLFGRGVILGQTAARLSEQIDDDAFIAAAKEANSPAIVETANKLVRSYNLLLRSENYLILASFVLLAGVIICLGRKGD